jgi:hypothetical protein
MEDIMGLLYKEIMITEICGAVCDKCHTEISGHKASGMYHLQHNFGFFSRIDMTAVDAVICEYCLEDILRDIHGAIWTKPFFVG